MANKAPENLHYFSEQARALMEGHARRSFDGGGGGGYDHPMEERVKNLEKFADEARGQLLEIGTRLTKIETKLDTFATTFATKEDMAKLGVAMHAEINAQTWKLVTFVCGFGTALVAATYFIATHVGK